MTGTFQCVCNELCRGQTANLRLNDQAMSLTLGQFHVKPQLFSLRSVLCINELIQANSSSSEVSTRHPRAHRGQRLHRIEYLLRSDGPICHHAIHPQPVIPGSPSIEALPSSPRSAAPAHALTPSDETAHVHAIVILSGRKSHQLPHEIGQPGSIAQEYTHCPSHTWLERHAHAQSCRQSKVAIPTCRASAARSSVASKMALSPSG